MLNLFTDNRPQDTSWFLRNMCTDEFQEYKEKGHYSEANTSYLEMYCVPEAAYEFWISDAVGDGICCTQGSGLYNVTYGGDEVAHGGEFAYSQGTSFGAYHSVPTPVSSSLVLKR